MERLIHKFDVFFDNLTQQKDKLNDFNALSSELEKIVQDFEIGARNKEVGVTVVSIDVFSKCYGNCV